MRRLRGICQQHDLGMGSVVKRVEEVWPAFGKGGGELRYFGAFVLVPVDWLFREARKVNIVCFASRLYN